MKYPRENLKAIKFVLLKATILTKCCACVYMKPLNLCFFSCSMASSYNKNLYTTHKICLL